MVLIALRFELEIALVVRNTLYMRPHTMPVAILPKVKA